MPLPHAWTCRPGDRPRRVVGGLIGAMIAACAALAGSAAARDTPAADREFFEKEVRPVLAARCQGCHGASKRKGGLRLDSRAALLQGGDSGPAVVPGNPAESPLIEAIHYDGAIQMPPKSKLPDAEIAALTRWVQQGAPWPDSPPQADSAAASTFDLDERARHWCFQPVRDPAVPAVRDASWPRTAIDPFILAKLEEKGLTPARDADRPTLLRRLSFDLTGLPPTPEEVRAFVEDGSPLAIERQVDRLLASPAYGERWGRHWLDLVRYAETSGHEFDYDIPEAWRYRDYVVRAFNQDLPYDQFLVEHLAGDLLPNPRRNPADQTNESVLGTGFFLLGEGTHSPVDLQDEQAARIDNQIDVLSKTFLGLTLACARCHDHKFDPISQNDYYAMAGYLRSSRHQRAFLDPPPRIADRARELEALQAELAGHPAVAALALSTCPTRDEPAPSPPPRSESERLFEGFDGATLDPWIVTGAAFGDRPTRPGDFRLEQAASAWVAHPLPPGMAHSGRFSGRLQGVLRSPSFTIERKAIHYLAAGRAGRINLVIDGFEKIRAPIYGGLSLGVDAEDVPRWYSQDVGMWLGHRAYIELADGATVNYGGARSEYFTGDGWIGVDAILFSDGPAPPAPPAEHPSVPLNPADPGLERWIERYARVEASLPAPTLGLALADGPGEDSPLFIRGNPHAPGAVVPRRGLEVLGGVAPPESQRGSGRLELARHLAESSNPLVARVIVNRLWKHHFGAGLVRTPDDFGLMGEPPTHPELLDWLAARLVESGWSLKRIHRVMVLSRTYAMTSTLTAGTETADPDNRWLHRMNVRRLEAEALRDAVLMVSGRLDRTTFGPSVPPYLTAFQEGRGRPAASGPLDGAGRRTIYLNLRRNFLPPLLTAFDFPAPATCVGRRNVSNVPAQALTLLNDPFLIEQAAAWANRENALGGTPEERIDRLYQRAFSRPPTAAERQAARAFLTARDDPAALASLCHVLMNVKEFLFIP